MNPPKIPDYTLHELIGEGSTGSVWVASHEGRDGLAVKALKALAINRPLLSDSLVKIYNGAPHPGVATVYDFDLASPQAYVAMELFAEDAQLADGRSVSRPRNLEALCGAVDTETGWRIATQIADAGAFLHRKRIAHCNLKPTNVLFEEGESPRAKLVDYSQGMLGGIEQIEPGESMFYAPPEQLLDPDHFFEGRGQRWDVFSFGVTVYRLITGRFPRLHDAIAELHKELSKQLDLHMPLKPDQVAAALEGEPDIVWPGEAEAEVEAARRRIVEQCLRLDPNDRYVDLREVLEEFRHAESESSHHAELEGLETKQEELADRAGKAKRRAVMFGLGAAAAAGVAAFGLYDRFADPDGAKGAPSVEEQPVEPVDDGQAQALADARTAQQAAENKLAAALDDLRDSQSAIDEVFEMIVARDGEGRALYTIPEGTLGSVLNYYSELIARHRDNPDMAEQVARAFNNSGELNMVLGDNMTARANLRNATALLDSLEAGGGGLGDMLMRRARAYQNLSDAETASGYERASAKSAQQANTIYKTLSERNPDSPTATRLFAASSVQVGRKMADIKQTGEAGLFIDRASRLLGNLDASNQANEADLSLFAEAGFERGRIDRAGGDREAAIKAQIETIDRYLALIEARPEVARYRFGLARAYGEAADLAAALGEPGEAQTANTEGADVLRELSDAYPDRPEYRFELARRLRAIAQGLKDSGARSEAIAEQEKALVLLEDLTTSHPNEYRYAYEFAILSAIQGDLLGLSKKTKEAIALGQQAVKTMQQLLNDDVDVEDNNAKRPKYRHALAAHYGKLGLHSELSGDKVAAKHCFDKALKQYETLAQANPDDKTANDGIAWANGSLSRIE